jgi:exosortase A-associated hydrolase 1
MNAIREDAFLFDRGDDRLVGIVATPSDLPIARLGVLIVVGGPQYRVGSHRQFVLLARALAAHGFAVMRFDCSGMGDSTGPERSFTERDDDIRAAIDAFVARVPSVVEVAIWGLCDAASAALLYAADDARVRHLVLLNPWVRSDAGLARTHLKHYYTRRLVDRSFWRDLLTGKVGVLRAVAGLAKTLRAARRNDAAEDDRALAFQARMARGWKRFTGDVLLFCSGDDLTAREFVDHAARDHEWSGLLAEPRVARCDLPEADHTFSRAVWRDRVAEETADWLARRIAGPSPEHRRGATAQPASGRARVTA